MQDSEIVVIGLGNILLGDEGLGVHALHLLQRRNPHLQVSFYDGGTRGLSLLPFLEEASRLLILDAVHSEASPGTMVELSKEQLLAAPPMKFSAHDIALPDLLALLRYRKGEGMHIKLLGIVPARLEPSPELSTPVMSNIPLLLNRAEEILKAWVAPEEPVLYQEGPCV